jgi:hypothetical protein
MSFRGPATLPHAGRPTGCRAEESTVGSREGRRGSPRRTCSRIRAGQGPVPGDATGYEETESRFLSRAPGLSHGRFCAALLRNDRSGQERRSGVSIQGRPKRVIPTSTAGRTPRVECRGPASRRAAVTGTGRRCGGVHRDFFDGVRGEGRGPVGAPPRLPPRVPEARLLRAVGTGDGPGCGAGPGGRLARDAAPRRRQGAEKTRIGWRRGLALERDFFERPRGECRGLTGAPPRRSPRVPDARLLRALGARDGLGRGAGPGGRLARDAAPRRRQGAEKTRIGWRRGLALERHGGPAAPEKKSGRFCCGDGRSCVGRGEPPIRRAGAVPDGGEAEGRHRGGMWQGAIRVFGARHRCRRSDPGASRHRSPPRDPVESPTARTVEATSRSGGRTGAPSGATVRQAPGNNARQVEAAAGCSAYTAGKVFAEDPAILTVAGACDGTTAVLAARRIRSAACNPVCDEPPNRDTHREGSLATARRRGGCDPLGGRSRMMRSDSRRCG